MSATTRSRLIGIGPALLLGLALSAQQTLAQDATTEAGAEATPTTATVASAPVQTMDRMPPRGGMPMGPGRGMYGGMPMPYGRPMHGGGPMQGGCRQMMGDGAPGKDRMAMKQQRREMMQQRHAKMDAHMQRVEERLERLEQLVQQLVEADKP